MNARAHILASLSDAELILWRMIGGELPRMDLERERRIERAWRQVARNGDVKVLRVEMMGMREAAKSETRITCREQRRVDSCS